MLKFLKDNNIPDNVHKTIAEFISTDFKKCKIIMMQSGGCLEGYHGREQAKTCSNCNNIYKRGEIFIFLEKGGDKILFKEYINSISKKILDSNYNLKEDYSYWADGPYLKIKDLFMENINITKIEDFKENGHSWELEKYEVKYVISGNIFWSLFRSFGMELAYIPNFYQSNLSRKSTVITCSSYYKIIGRKYVKDKLHLINKIYHKYTHPQN